MMYNEIKNYIDQMIDDIEHGKEECQKMISFNLIKEQNIPAMLKAKLLYPLDQIKFTLFCPFLMVHPDVEFSEIYSQGIEEDYFKILRLVSRFVTVIDMLRSWVQTEVPDMIRWGEGVIYDKNGRTTKLPTTFFI